MLGKEGFYCYLQILHLVNIKVKSPVLRKPWKQIHLALQDIFECEIAFESNTMLLRRIPSKLHKRDKINI